ncbi:MAG TPA: FtsQ-type POTRA domain-containing protein [Candidatus Aminicenantes bacterium]|nr:FtsQ-type POTRA domain-containing protein [Candidatus Aminicenantes bacterium]HRY65072.1 FtsQ-type POTRA domain-containing protein [Candidatus Aminicenantes bacterium]HRZ71985.1 FtsQ-type POTRA domain-containing protein [Candidatus Aminicenantes bacterium]
MATVIGDLGRERKPSLFVRRLGLRSGEKAPALRKGRRRRVFGVRQVVVLLALQAAFFVALREAWLFLVTWDELTIRKVAVTCAKPELRRALEAYYAMPRLGNILLCDLEAVRTQVRRLAWVKDAGVQKVFPSGLRITVVERTPFLLLERGGLWLADEEGRPLEPVYSPDEYALPVVSDETGFAAGFAEKWEAARRCWRSLPPGEQRQLVGVRCSDYGTLELAFRDDPVRVVVAAAAPADGLAGFRAGRAGWEGLFGPLALANMSYDGRVYLRPAEPAGDDLPQPDKGD